MKPVSAIALLLAIALSLAGCAASEGGLRTVVLGIDGMDHRLTTRFMAEGKMPAFVRLAEAGGFQPLGTSVPPLSPVAWSNFITGMDSGGHGIYDFIHRDPKTMIPYLSTSRATGAARTLKLGRWQLPLGGGTELLRQGTPFWELLEDSGIDTTIVRMPANYPPSGAASRELSGMGTPDVLGTYGTFSFYTSELFAFQGEDVSGGDVYEVWEEDGVVQGELVGPRNPFEVDSPKVTVPFWAYPDHQQGMVKLVVGAEERLLGVGEWSDWVPLELELAPAVGLRGACRFYLRALSPEFELYATPINVDPKETPGFFNPVSPIAHPPEYAAELASSSGPYYTQGMPEDVQALKAGVLNRDEFLVQAELAGAEVRDQLAPVLDTFLNGSGKGGFLFYYFGNLDMVSHMLYRPLDPEHPAYDPETDPDDAGVVERLYRQADEVVGRTLDRLPPDALLVVMSDHGFAPLRRRMSLNSWLRDRGYLAVRDPDMRDDPGLFINVDWRATRAYGLGLNGLYVNLRGREKDGIVDPGEREALLREIGDNLRATVDPATGERAVAQVFVREEVYDDRGALEIGPDMILGYAWSYGGNDDSSLGGVPAELFTDNTSEWSGDHGMDPAVVPGILLTSRPLRQTATRLEDLAAAILAEYGIDRFPPHRTAD